MKRTIILLVIILLMFFSINTQAQFIWYTQKVILNMIHTVLSDFNGHANFDSLTINGAVHFADSNWSYITVTQTNFIKGASNDPNFGAVINGLYSYLFDPTNLEELFGEIHLPSSYREGTDIVPCIHWSPINTDTDTTVWVIEYSWANIDTSFGATTNDTVYCEASGTADQHEQTDFSAISGSGKTIGSVLLFRIARDPANGHDDNNDDAGFLGIHFLYRMDTYGAKQKHSKW